MEFCVHDENKYVSIWLTRAESVDMEFKEKLKPLYQEYKQKKYRVVVFESGGGDLSMLTKDLLQHNLELSVKNEM